MVYAFVVSRLLLQRDAKEGVRACRHNVPKSFLRCSIIKPGIKRNEREEAVLDNIESRNTLQTS